MTDIPYTFSLSKGAPLTPTEKVAWIPPRAGIFPMLEVNSSNTSPPVKTHLPPRIISPIPGSKSQTNRALLLAACAPTPTVIKGVLTARDTVLMRVGLEKLGAAFTEIYSDTLLVTPFQPTQTTNITIDCGLAGTVMRFLPALAATFTFPVTFTADKQANKRPLRPLLDFLSANGATLTYHGENTFPFTIQGPLNPLPTQLHIDAKESSQFLSAILLTLPRWHTLTDLTQPTSLTASTTSEKLRITAQPPSIPHIQMTVEALRSFGFNCEIALNADGCVVDALGKKLKSPHTYQVEPDLTTALPFLATPAFTGRAVQLANWPAQTTQPLASFLPQLKQLGIHTKFNGNTLLASPASAPNKPQQIDMRNFGELTPVAAALATQLKHPTTFTNLTHLRGHETNRILALQTEIRKLRGRAEASEDTLTIYPLSVDYPQTQRTVLHTYHDHRMVMFAALLGLKYPVQLDDLATVAKTLPDFASRWETLIKGEAGE